jgi:hypothetical protein
MYTLQPTLRSLRKAGHGCRPDVVYAACQHRSGRLVARQRHDNPMVIPERPPGKGIPDRLELPPDPFEHLGFQLPRLQVRRGPGRCPTPVRPGAPSGHACQSLVTTV